MAKYWCYFLFLLWFSYLILCSILLFTRGFLLTRVTQKQNASCETFYPTFCDSPDENATQCSEDDRFSVLDHLHDAPRICLPQKAKVVLLVIDALRYDFVTYDPKLQHNALPFQNKLPVIDELLKTHPNHSRLYKFIADPPTTTMQRLKALTTGSLPTFIDAGSNFATSEINEDNVVDQLVKRNGKVVFMGDDTWSGLYPNRFTRSYPFPSFNVHDLDTVDIGVVTNLYPELKKYDFDLLIAHFLGVDHCGHRYGPYHSEMSRKLSEMNEVIENVIEELRNDSILIVIGDHGMTTTGDHGGGSDNEITSAMFVFSEQPLVNLSSPDTIKQVDLVPTLAAILGIPVPFSNLGAVVLDSTPIKTDSSDWRTSLHHSWANVEQVVEYIKEYSRDTNTFSEEALGGFFEKYRALRDKVHTVKSWRECEKFAKTAREYVVSLREMCEEVWVRFDSFSMSRGLLVSFLSTFFVYVIIDGIPGEQLQDIFMSTFLLCSFVALVFAGFVSCVLYYFKLVDDLLLNVYFSTSIVSLFMLVVLVIQNWEVIALHWYEKNKKNRFPNLILRLVLVFGTCAVFSNSFIVEEAHVTLYLLLTLTFFSIYTPKNPSAKWQGRLKLILLALVVAFLARLSMHFWQCREEQQWCLTHDSFGTRKLTSASRIVWTVTLVSLALLVTLTRIWLRSCGNLVGFSLTVMLARYTPTVIVVCTGGYWILRQQTRKSFMVPWQPDVLAWVVYALTGFGVVCSVCRPLTVYVLPRKLETLAGEQQRNLIPLIFRQVKNLFGENKSDDEVPVVCGLATVYSAVYVVVGVYFSLLFSLLLGDLTAPSAVIMFLTTCLLITAISVARIQKMTDIEQLLEIPGSSILALVLLAQYFFYGTGHQPTFPNIAWEAAFIGTGGSFTNNFIPATLVIINTFGSYIFMGFTLPLLLIAPFTLFVMMPSVVAKKAEVYKDFSRGEILLYERSGKLLKGVFVVCCKYIMCHSIKVFVCMMGATIHCRHLMVWKIFAPKLIFESIAMLITLGSVLVGYLLLIQIHRKVDNLVYTLNKQNR